MASNDITMDNLGDKIFEEAKVAAGSKYEIVKKYLKAESEKLAITLRMILDGVAAGEITQAEAKVLLNQQKLAMASVLTASEGMGIVLAQDTVNAALNVGASFINGKIGFTLF